MSSCHCLACVCTPKWEGKCSDEVCRIDEDNWRCERPDCKCDCHIETEPDPKTPHDFEVNLCGGSQCKKCGLIEGRPVWPPYCDERLLKRAPKEEPKPDYCGCEDPSWVPSQFIGLFCTNCKRYVNPLNEPKEPEKCEHTYKYDKKYRWYWCEFCEQPMPHDYYTREEIDNKEYLGREYTDRAILQWRDEEKAFRTELLDCLYEFCGSKEVKALRKKFL